MRYAITNFTSGPMAVASATGAAQRRAAWLSALRGWAQERIGYIQLREKSLEAGELVNLAREGMELLESLALPVRPKLLVNGRPDVALAAGADGVHLPSGAGEVGVGQVRQLFRQAGRSACLVSRSCHTLADVRLARDEGCNLVLFGPVFGKEVQGVRVQAGVGLEALRLACLAAGPVPVLALGGVTLADASACRAAGAAGVAGIRLFQG